MKYLFLDEFICPKCKKSLYAHPQAKVYCSKCKTAAIHNVDGKKCDVEYGGEGEDEVLEEQIALFPDEDDRES